MSREAVLVLNSGSSSLKAGLYRPDSSVFAGEHAELTAEASGIGQGGCLSVQDRYGATLHQSGHPLGSQEEALAAIAELLRQHGMVDELLGIGHRVVHGGPHLRDHTRLTLQVFSTLASAVHFAPLHLPNALSLIRQAQMLYPDTPQAVCFDTAFHRTLPPVARRLPLPEKYAKAGVERYGFHGLSYESLIAQLRARPEPLPDRIVLAHLGGGSSLCAVQRGRSVDTTMGLTPTGGILMGTRTGDLDPGALLFLARACHLSPDALESLVNHQAGLAAVSEGTGDMQAIEHAMADSRLSSERKAAAQLAFDQFSTAVAKAVAALTVSLAGLDLLVFAGGIGEHSALLRAAVVNRLAPFGLRLAAGANAAHAAIIHAPGSIVPIHILPAQEDPVIAAHARRLVQ